MLHIKHGVEEDSILCELIDAPLQHYIAPFLYERNFPLPLLIP